MRPFGRLLLTDQGATHAQDLATPTYHPYNPSMRPRRLDYIVTKGGTPGPGRVIACKDRAASDHDGVAVPWGFHKGGGARRSTWGPRKLRPPHQTDMLLRVPPPTGEDPHQTLCTIAKAITVPGGRADAFRESSSLAHHHKLAQQAAPRGQARQAWKLVSRQRKQEFRQWKQTQAERAANLDWRALRSIQQPSTHRGWQLQLTDDANWQSTLQQHFKSIFAKPVPPAAQARRGELRQALRAKCKTTPWIPFSLGELHHTSHKWAHNRSTGPDGVSHEAAQLLLLDPEWGERIRELLSDMLYRGAVPQAIEQGITVLLPKIPRPLAWGDTRPITLSSTFLKWAAQLLLHRAGEKVRHGGVGLQWARRGRQGVELVAILRRVVQMSKDWGVKTWIVKLDIRKAFDSVWQHSLSELVAAGVGGIPSPRFPISPERQGGDQPWEALLWLSLLETRAM
ncbi:Retrovirus-related Pol polyprotein from type-1 retrotransposable element R2 [Symbiodinium microadriaticum]|uniref:Retrovirus-related Pol polyprotein from type-1 retrotransposable element R2 n=1 Tax=Symbiodinium microadriaticum TaxID=2951 RepID=A0A1Q9DVN2_SYMMI|nr:Retrovirus-related Pol polyprotein from type-1 retrotransposable element R2 [Symbiodinium microadriaticum]